MSMFCTIVLSVEESYSHSHYLSTQVLHPSLSNTSTYFSSSPSLAEELLLPSLLSDPISSLLLSSASNCSSIPICSL